jgi:plastocyanin
LAATLTLAPTALAEVTVDFGWSPSSPEPGETVTFTGEASGNAKEIRWDLDNDGEYDDATGATASRSFSEAGSYRIRIRAEANNGETATRERTVRVSTGMTSSFSWSPEAPTTADAVTFSSTSTIKSGEITSYRWDLDGDRQFDDGEGPSASQTFATPGEYRVGLRVTDNTGMRSFAYNTVVVTEPAPPPPPPPAPEPLPIMPAGPQWLNPFPSVRIRGRATRGGARLSLVATRAPVGTKMKVRCKGRRCPKRRVLSYEFKQGRLRLRGHERFYTAGTRLEFFIWQPGMVGKYTRFVMRRRKAPRRSDQCLYPGGKWPGACPR